MATTTKLVAANGFYGNSGNASYTNSAAKHMYVGKYGSPTFRSRMTFPALGSVANIGNSRIAVTKAELHIRRNDGGPANVTAGCSGSSAWGAALAGSGSANIAATMGWKTIDVTACASAIAGFTGNWYMHLLSSEYIRFNGTGSDWKPYLMVTWEYVAATIRGDKDSVTLGETVTYTIQSEVSNETHRLEYRIGDSSGVIAAKGGSSISWVPPVSLATEITDDDSGMVEILMTAYDASGNVQRTERYYQTVAVPDSVEPVISSAGASLIGGLSGYGLTGRSYAAVAPVINMNSAQGATIASVAAEVTNGSAQQRLEWTNFTESGAGVFICATKNTAVFATKGAATIVLTVTDSRGRPVEKTQDYTVCEYAQPVISGFSVERYEPVYDSNEQITGYQPSDLGGYVWVNLKAAVQAVAPAGAQLNTLKWEIAAVNAESGSTVKKSGTGAQAVNISQNRTIFPDAMDAAATWNYTVTVTDTAGGKAVQYSSVLPARANFALAKSKYGASFGGLPKGTQANPMLESHYPVHGYDGFFGADGYRLDRAVKTQVLAPTGNFAAYTADGEAAANFTPRVTRVGPLVFLSGMLKNTAALTLNATEVTVATLPAWAKPLTHVNVLQQGSTTFVWWMRVKNDGSLTFSRYRNTSSASYESITAGRQFPITACWIAADAFD